MLRRVFPLISCCNMPLPWQCNLHHFQKVCLTHVHLKANMCAKFHLKCFKNVQVMCKYSETITRIFFFFNLGLTFCTRACGQRNHYHDNTLFTTVKKCVSHIFISRPTCVPSLTEIRESIMKQSQDM